MPSRRILLALAVFLYSATALIGLALMTYRALAIPFLEEPQLTENLDGLGKVVIAGLMLSVPPTLCALLLWRK